MHGVQSRGGDIALRRDIQELPERQFQSTCCDTQHYRNVFDLDRIGEVFIDVFLCFTQQRTASSMLMNTIIG